MKTLDELEPRIPISSLPYTIDQSGSYYLTANLISAGSGILVDADDVTIDLMGYTMSGGTGYGIYMNGRSNVEIKNGTIKNFSSIGVYEHSYSAEGHRIVQIRTINNGAGGIILHSRGNLIKDCTAS